LNLIQVSFIIPAYNAEKTIVRCLSSILGIDFPRENFEIIVVNNNSTDKTELLVAEFSGIQCLNEKSQGRSFARNSGAFHAKGDFLVFIDADTYISKEWLNESLKAFLLPNIAGGQGPIIPIDDYFIQLSLAATKGTHNLLELTIKESPMIDSAACIYRRLPFLKVGAFDTRLKRHEDIDLSKRFVLAGYDLVIIPKAIAQKDELTVKSFEEGFTKVKYLNKWKNFWFLNSSDKNVWEYFQEEVVSNIMRYIQHRNSFYLSSAMASLFKSAGRVCGNIFTSQIKPWKPLKDLSGKRTIYKESKPYIEINLEDFKISKIQDRS
jgi:glycosyltransferase involved in cell wall biosynthesis